MSFDIKGDWYFYKKENGQTVKIARDVIESYQEKYKLEEEDAIKMYLDDNNIEEDAELTKQEIESGKFKVSHQVDEKKPRKVREAKISDEKQEIFNQLYEFLQGICDVEVKTPNKLFVLKKNGLDFKLDLTQTRVKKES